MDGRRLGAGRSRSEVKELAYERAFKEWTARQGFGWTRGRYARTAAGGETLYLRLMPKDPPRGIVMAVHGAGNDALFALVGLFKQLLARGFAVFTFDLDGHGRHSTTVFRAELASDSICMATRHAREGAPELPFHVVGTSLGGAVLLSALPDLSRCVASAALLVSPLRIRFSLRAVLAEIGIATVRTLWRERQHYGLTGLIPSFGPYKRSIYPLRFASAPPAGAFGYVHALNRALDSLQLHAASRCTTTPVLLVYGGRDRVVPEEQGRALHSLIPSSELLLLKRESHLSTPLAPAAVDRLLGWIEHHNVPR